MKFSLLILALVTLIACKRKQEEPYQQEDCGGSLDYRIESVAPETAFPKDSIQILEVNGMDVRNVSSLELESFCNVTFKVKVSSREKIMQLGFVSTGLGMWMLDTTNISRSNLTFNFRTDDLSGFRYYDKKFYVSFDFYDINSRYETTNPLWISRKRNQ